MPFTIHASRNGQSVETQRIHPVSAVAKARNLEVAGWDVYVTDFAGRHFSFAELDNLELLLPSGTPRQAGDPA